MVQCDRPDKAICFPSSRYVSSRATRFFFQGSNEGGSHETVALACEKFMLVITAQGYTTCPIEGFDEVLVKQILGLGRVSAVVMVISVERGNPQGV
jgi:nitroreductase